MTEGGDFRGLGFARFARMPARTPAHLGRRDFFTRTFAGITKRPVCASISCEIALLVRQPTEDSTSELRYDDRAAQALRTATGKPVANRVRLYRGDYLIPGKASVGLRIEGTGR